MDLNDFKIEVAKVLLDHANQLNELSKLAGEACIQASTQSEKQLWLSIFNGLTNQISASTALSGQMIEKKGVFSIQ